MATAPTKYNTLIALVILAELLKGALEIGIKNYITPQGAASLDSTSIVLMSVAPLIYMAAYIPPALWAIKNRPSSLNTWLSGLLILGFGLWGISIYLIMIAIDCFRHTQLIAEHVPPGGRVEAPRP